MPATKSKQEANFKYAYEPWMTVADRRRFRNRTIKQMRRDEAKRV